VIALTNVNLSDAVQQRRFREDLFYRLNVVHIHVPSVRERQTDVGLLIDSFLTSYAAKHGRAINGLSRDARALLSEYEFPGNVRELANTIERAVIVASGSEIQLGDLPEPVRIAVQSRRRRAKPLTLAEVEAEYVNETLELTRGNKTEAAKILGISRKNLYERLARKNKSNGGA
jgi:DNA-binding NtrC family response regulator